MQMLEFQFKFHWKFVQLGSNKQSGTGSDNRLVPNDGLDYWRRYALLGIN